ncbi:tyrosine-type recombinase/integrase [Bacteroidetes bacterium endosymbiont of Geopemphigus sp.]|uniref:tyrosine-type recombinase/integrase n=1 Tax=Bacteroidetes bacterium endosymbiont of Geopemphigus sp. TaxID=2047937 RepID=UPI000CD19D8F|nr:tyrosine-type recombinase/integrase [Bacteroidetes bacterium endosymbiont of Geopemphigus sp.]
MSLSKFLDYLSYEKRYSRHTLLAYKNDLESFQFYLQGSDKVKKIEKVNKYDVRSFLIDLSRKNLSHRSINRKLASLRSYYFFLQKIQRITINPLHEISSLKEKKEAQVAFSINEIDRLFSHELFSSDFLGHRDQLILKMLYYTGMRRGELIELRLKNIDIYAQILLVMGKRKKERKIPIRESLAHEINHYIPLRAAYVKEGECALFITEKGQKTYPKYIYNIVHKYLALVSLKTKKSPHMLRHTFATHLLDHGADLNSIKELLGHSSLAATQIYTHSSMRRLKEIYKKTHPRDAQK